MVSGQGNLVMGERMEVGGRFRYRLHGISHIPE